MEGNDQNRALREIQNTSESNEELKDENNPENVSLDELRRTESAANVSDDIQSITNIADPAQNKDKTVTKNKPHKRASNKDTNMPTPSKKLKVNKNVKTSISDGLYKDYKPGVAVADHKYKKKTSLKSKEQSGTMYDSGNNSTPSNTHNHSDNVDHEVPQGLAEKIAIDNSSSLRPNNNLESDSSYSGVPKTDLTSSKKPRVSSQLKPPRNTVWGNEYQRILQILLRQRGTKSSSMAIEVSGVGSMDDMVYNNEKENRCRMFQVKYSNSVSTHKIKTSELLSTNWTNINSKKLYLLKYFVSFCAIKENDKYAGKEIEEVTCLTNRELVCTKKPMKLLLEVDLKNDDLLYFGDCKATKYALSVDFFKEDRVVQKLNSLCKRYLPTKFDKADEIILEFQQKIRVVVNYPDYKDTRTRVFKEVLNDDTFDFEKCELLYCCVEYFETKLLMDEEKFITREEWQNVIEELKEFINILKTTGISELKTCELIREVDGVVFHNESLKDIFENIKTFLATDGQNILCFSNAQHVQFNAIKVLRSLEKISKGNEGGANKFKFIFCTVKTLLAANSPVDSYLSAASILPVITCSSGKYDENTKILARDLGNQIEGTKKKIIIVSNGENLFLNTLKEIVTGIVFSNNCNHSFRDLTSTSQKKILGYEITFQGKQLKLSSLFKNDIEFACDVLDENYLWEIINKKKECVINNTEAFVSPGYDERYYIERNFCQNIVDRAVFKKRIEKDIFLVTGSFGVENEFIVNVLHENGIKKLQEWDPSKGYSSGVVIGLPDTSHGIYEQLCGGSGDTNVHLIMIKSDRDLVHIDSKHPFKRLIKTETKIIPENYFIKKVDSEKVFIFVSDSGVGKSTILTSICEKRKEQMFWVLKIDLNKISKHISPQIPEDYTSINTCVGLIEKTLYSTNPDSSLELKLFRHILSPSQKNLHLKTVLLLDGFNEIQPSQDFSYESNIDEDVKRIQRVVHVWINTLRNHCNLEQVVITAQVQEKFELENNLQVSAYFLKHLDRQEQKELMARYWAKEYNSRSPPLEIKLSVLRCDAENVIEEWEKIMTDEKDKSFTNVSLNVIMLADVLIDTDRRFSDTIELKNLYSKFVSNKIVLYFKGQSECSEVIKAMTECSFRKIHQECSLKKMFSPMLIEKLPGMNELELYERHLGLEVMSSTLAKIGLLMFNKGNMSFSHESFAQYFISEYIAYNMKLHPVQNLFIKYVLPQKNMKLCRKFLDTIYKNKFAGEDKLINLSADCRNSLNNSKNCIHLLPSLRENNLFVVRMVLELLNEEERYKYVDKIVQETLKKKFNGNHNGDILLRNLMNLSLEELPSKLVKIIKGDYNLAESSINPSVLQVSPVKNDYTADAWDRSDEPSYEEDSPEEDDYTIDACDISDEPFHEEGSPVSMLPTPRIEVMNEEDKDNGEE
ncbi:uncharacterized protein LOC124357941 isoform X3 [Homalodisca vitripennis]|uniref:uncharacterized protein LOC124357941 isoform X3 n=1 Tax=Homalodisca vitripennis TaxID=197043 RepID=UPI001EE9B7B9|nr:uncharacterized protein LOC124357941 isoform X3 [Homalodisca vitripennis]